MFSQSEIETLRAFSSTESADESVPERLRNHPVLLLAQILESGRSQRFFDSDPYSSEEFPKDNIANAVREMHWEGLGEFEEKDVDGDGIPESVLETGWKTNDSGLEFLRRIKVAAGIV